MLRYDGEPADLMVAVHAWRSAEAIERFKTAYPDRPVVLQLSGTDIYGTLKSDPVPTLRSMELADRLVALNDLAWKVVPRRLHKKLLVMHQSAAPLTEPRQPSPRAVIVSVIGHLRDVKDPLRAAEAARLLPADSRVRIEQVGRAYTPDWAERARAEMAANPRYRWRDDVPAAAVRRLLARSHAMAITSLSEGGANVISEAVVAGVPILASRMDGNVGLLGARLSRLFPGRRHKGAGAPDAAARGRPAFCRSARQGLARPSPAVSPGAGGCGLARSAGTRHRLRVDRARRHP